MDKGKKEPVILITNDDGITAPGIKNLIEAVKDLGKVVVVAPDKPQSGMGHELQLAFLSDYIRSIFLKVLRPTNVRAHQWIV